MQLSTEELISLFTDIAADMDNPHWRMGDQLIELRQQGYKKQQLEEVCEKVFGIGRSAVNNHYRTSLIFPADMRALEINWALHERCGRAVKDVRKQADYAKAHDWLAKVQGGTYTYTSLEDAMKGNQDDQHKPDPVYLCKRAEAVVIDIVGHTNKTVLEVTLQIEAADLGNIPSDDYMFSKFNIPVLLTMFIPAQVHTSEHSEAAT